MKVLNLGSLNYDYVYSVDHIAAPGETISSTQTTTFLGGKGLNQSIALARAGVPVYHAGQVGEDGDELLSACTENGVNHHLIRKVPGKSGHTVIQVDKNGQNSILLYGGSNRSLSRDYISEALSFLDKNDILLLQNEINDIPYIIEQAYAKEIQIFLNPSPFDNSLVECLDKISMFLLNEIEGEQITGKKNAEDMLSEFSRTYPNAKVVLTLGAGGSFYQDRQNRFHQDIFSVPVVDTTAAGDTFTGFFISSLIDGKAIPECLRLAAKAASIAVSKKGATSSIPYLQEVL